MFNICNGQNGGLESSLHGMAQGQVDCVVLQEKKLAKGVYTRESIGFQVMLKELPIDRRGGIAVFYR